MKESAKVIIENLIVRYPDLANEKENICEAVEILIESYKNDGTLLICGNGGSAADSLHIAGELMKGFVKERALNDKEKEIYKDMPDGDYICDNLQKGLRTISLCSETALFTAYCNDKEPDIVFAQQVFGYGKRGDVLLAISTSGNSENIVLASQVAKANGIKVIGLTGSRVGRLDKFSDVTIKTPYSGAYEVQERHLPIYHAICLALEEEFF